jgi:predicted DsbA family dithiol-disulfide isomerase
MMTVEVWSDVACPWCCIGRAHLQSALAEFEHAAEVEVVWRSFELDPTAPAVRVESLTDLLAAKYGVGPAEVESMFDDVRERAARLGLDFRFDLARAGSTFDAHRLLHLARALGQQDTLKGRLFRAHFTEGEAVGDPDTLARIAVEAGLPADSVAEVLASEAFADAVRADEAEARALQVTGVPFFVIDRRYAVAGAQPPEQLLAALQRAWDERSDQDG